MDAIFSAYEIKGLVGYDEGTVIVWGCYSKLNLFSL